MENGLNSGAYHNLSERDYHADPCKVPSLSRSTIYELLFNSPAHAWHNHPRLNPHYYAKVSDTFDIGSAAHPLLLQGIDKAVVIEADDWRKKDTQALRDEAREAKKIPLLRKQYDRVVTMVETAKRELAKSELAIQDLQTEGNSEVSYIWTEGKTVIRTRLDWRSNDNQIIVDYKTTAGSANPNEFSRNIVSNGYDIQAALYSRGVKAIDGIEPKFIFFIQETVEPYFCSTVALDPMFLEMGKQKVQYGIDLWQHCLDTNNWPGYPTEICWLEAPTWALTQWESVAERITL